jgi:general secretion pathway protein C
MKSRFLDPHFWRELWRQRLVAAARSRERLDKLPPLTEILRRLRVLRWPAYLIAGLLLGDLAMQAVSVFVLGPMPARKDSSRVLTEKPYVQNRAVYETVIRKNAFCPGCPVPDMEIRNIERPKDCNKAQPLEGANIKLIGTIVLSEKKFSVATASDGGGEPVALSIGDSFKSYGKVFDIRRNKLCLALPDGALRFVEIPEDSAFKFGQPLPNAMPASPSEGITRSSDTEVEIKKSYLMEKLSDPNVLFQAHAVPDREYEGGPIRGFKVLSIVPGSVYESLGIQAGDVITEVNGEPMNSISRAQELYGGLRNTAEVSIGMLRNGQKTVQRFKVK